eukprot:Tbor_TRINITY_DN5951_c1_g1::TRINITY_DN5951_c1_g1_i2::g.19001::m.19001/K08765/CPT1A; carnitine O-palmitoyltransferase 1, liver isoform
MAEARMAAMPRIALQRSGHEVDTSSRVPQVYIGSSGFVLYIPPPRSLLRLAKRKLQSVFRQTELAFAPVPIYIVPVVIAGVTHWVLNSSTDSWQRSGWIAQVFKRIIKHIPSSSTQTHNMCIAATTSIGTSVVLLGFAALQRSILRALLSYHGWMFEGKKKSLLTKIWYVLLTKVYLPNPNRLTFRMYAFEGILPTLPLPRIEDTVRKYMVSMEGLVSEEELSELKDLGDTFLKNEGKQLQFYLKLKWWTSKNYMADWWMNYVYLRQRDPIFINSNWLGVNFSYFTPTKIQTARAACIVHNLLDVRGQIDAGTFAPLCMSDTTPLCMDQYKYAFATTRIPGPQQDYLQKFPLGDSRHIVVLHKGRMYRVQCYTKGLGRLLTPLELQRTLDSILLDDYEPELCEKYIPALTCINRSEWAEIRENIFMASITNRQALNTIEKAAFVLSLDDFVPSTLSEKATHLLCGNGYNRWEDKSFNICISPNGLVGCNVEHSWGDAPCFAHISEYCTIKDETKEQIAPDGNCLETAEDIAAKKNGSFRVYSPERLRFHETRELKAVVDRAFKVTTAAIDDLQLHIEIVDDHPAKGIAKKVNCSPDAYAQMALQLAYYRDQGHFDQTYEPAMTRLFCQGRTETIRSASSYSCAFVKSVEDPKINDMERFRLLFDACEDHQQRSREAATGRGIDRHLFSLYVASVGKDIPSPFLENVLKRKWKLSTSQVAHRQLPNSMHLGGSVKNFLTSGGGFGPVADDGYGVLYTMADDDYISFTITSKRSATNTDSVRFGQHIGQALRDMKCIAEAYMKEKNK